MANVRGPQKLPSVVCLRAIGVMDASALREALNASRANLWCWRRFDGMPRPYRSGNNSYTPTAAIAAWCCERSIRVEWI